VRKPLAIGLAFIVITVFGTIASGSAAGSDHQGRRWWDLHPNGLVAETFHFLPGFITVPSGATLTFVKV
jgi:hypothetical protein